MSDYNWCHGPECHTHKTQDRIRGVKGSKVLRTKKIKSHQNRSMFGNGGGNIWDYFCNHRCLMDFVDKHTQAMLNIEPRLEALETPIEVTTETREDWRGNPYKTKVINEVDNNINP
tara:strand:- start:290 stop:637 length:348 start_codon:yes stop_codon:yes gene_type:complete